MQISNIEITNFRSIRNINFSSTLSTSVICGLNSCGKSNILRALRLAFLPSYNADRMAGNVSNSATSPNAAAKVKLTFDSPTAELQNALELSPETPFTYTVAVKRNGKHTAYLNGVQLTAERRSLFLDSFLVVHVPPIRDLNSGGLEPFRDTLLSFIRRTRGADSLSRLNNQVKNSIQDSGKQFLASSQAMAKNLLHVDGLSIDTDLIDLEDLIPKTGIKFIANQRETGLDKLGTGHQSSVILSLYRQLGTATGKFVIYLFEEPDNHLHPTSLRATAEDLKQCATPNSQVFITTHSPYLINQFPLKTVLPLLLDATRCTVARKISQSRSERDLRVAFAKYGLMPIEALLAKKVVVVEGPNDVILLRTLIELKTGFSPDRQDILIIPAIGKDSITDLCMLLTELGATWAAFMDWDATEDTRQPIFQLGLTQTDITKIQADLTSIMGKMRKFGNSTSKPYKSLQNLHLQVTTTPTTFIPDFKHSALGNFLMKCATLTTQELADIEISIRKKRTTKLNSKLASAQLRIWSDSPESLLMPSSNAEDIVENRLIHFQILQNTVQSSNRRQTLFNKLHNLAHEPAILSDIVEELWNANELRGIEFRDAMKHAM